MKRRRLSALILAALSGWSALGDVTSAEACGFVGRLRVIRAEDTVPAVAVENVLVIHDAASGLQHFVREVRFATADESFGFIVPTPSQPEVAKVDRSPFAALGSALAFRPPAMLGFGSGHGRLGGGSRGGGSGPPAVEVLSVQRVGKFVATVLAARDPRAFAEWLAANGFHTPAPVEDWVGRYVRLGFYFTAFRYDPPVDDVKAKGRAMGSETVRISFRSPHAFYPYREPELGRKQSDRLLSLWYVSAQRGVPVAAVAGVGKNAGELEWVRPWHAGATYQPKRSDLAKMIGADLGARLPEGDTLHVQTFRDWKTERAGFGDVLLVPAKAVTFDAAQIAARRTLLAVLDPSLEPAK